MRGRDEDTEARRLPYAASRRRVLAGGLAVAGALAAAGCRNSGGAEGTGGNSGVHALAGPLSGTLALVGLYDAASAAQPSLAARLAPLRAEHWTHVTALSAAMGRSVPSAAPPPSAPAGLDDARTALGTVRTAERTAQGDAVTACVGAPAAYAALLGSIAACRATHLEVLT